jgi:hypothetical protein
MSKQRDSRIVAKTFIGNKLVPLSQMSLIYRIFQFHGTVRALAANYSLNPHCHMRTYNVLAPENADVNAKARFKVKLLPEPEADELAALTVHWLFCSAAPSQ